MEKNKLKELRVALVHDFFREFGGAERVVEVLHEIFPKSDVYTALINPKNLKIHWYRMQDWHFIISWFGKIPIIKDYPSLFRFLTPNIWESFDFSKYDLVISSSGWFMSKGIITRPETLHLSYVHHQNKFLTYYETPDDWQRNWLKQIYGYLVGPGLRMWDFIGSQRPDILIANSNETKTRIAKYYRREATVIYPPVNDPSTNILEKIKETGDYYLTVNRLSKPKHIEVLIQAANHLGFTFYVVGKGKEYSYLKSIAKKNVIFTGEISDIELTRLLFGAKAFLFASVDEEFGIAPVEAMMFGVPVIAYESGGLKETVINGENGYLVSELSSKAFIKAIALFEKQNYSDFAKNAYLLAKRFSKQVFCQKIRELVIQNLKK